MNFSYRMILLMLFCGQIALNTQGQDVGFSQFYDQPLLRNPALAGIFTGDLRVAGSYRNQWQSVTVPYRTFGLSAELKTPLNALADDNLTIGLQLIRDVAGTSQFSTMQILPAVNYSIPVGQGNSYLSVGFMGGLMQQKFDPSKLILNDQFVAGSNGTFSILPASSQVFNNTSTNYFDLSTGLSFNGSVNDVDYYAGAGMFHLTRPGVGYFDGNKILLNRKLAMNLGLSAKLNETDQFICYADYFSQLTDSYKATGIKTLQFGMMYSHDLFVLDDDRKAISFGALYRLDDAIIPVLRLEFLRMVAGLSYDININKLVTASQSRGGFELTLSFKSLLNYSNSDLRQSKCPRFGL